MNTAARNQSTANDAPETKGRTVFALGPVELWLVAIVGITFVGGCGAWMNAVSADLRELSRSSAIIAERVARIEGKLEGK